MTLIRTALGVLFIVLVGAVVVVEMAIGRNKVQA